LEGEDNAMGPVARKQLDLAIIDIRPRNIKLIAENTRVFVPEQRKRTSLLKVVV
jgi:hypothetical protein